MWLSSSPACAKVVSSFFLMMRRPPRSTLFPYRSTLFPYTTLFRSVHVVQFSVGNANKGGDIAVQVQQGVHLHGGPRKKCQAQVNGGRVQSIQALVEVHAERLVGVERPRDFNQDIGQTRRRCASRVFRWRRPECCAPPCRETPGDRVSRSRIGGRLRCPAGSRGKSVARRPSPSTDPSKKASSAEDDRRNGPRISETPGEGDGRSTLRKRTGRCASLIVEKRGRGAPAQFSAARSSNRFPLKFPPRHWIERVCWPPQSTLPDTSEFPVVAQPLLDHGFLFGGEAELLGASAGIADGQDPDQVAGSAGADGAAGAMPDAAMEQGAAENLGGGGQSGGEFGAGFGDRRVFHA